MDESLIRKRALEYISLETDLKFKAEVQALLDKGDEKELEDRFYADLEFGTGGLRGLIGGGYNRMNSFVVGRATQGLSEYLIKSFPGKKLSAVIAYDSRRFSSVFAEDAARIFAGNGIKTYLFSALRPTPELSFAIRELKCATGIVVTASHNPPQYNGYKAYWSDGAQIIPPHDEAIIRQVGKVRNILSLSREEALAKGLLVYIDSEIDEKYVAMVKSKLVRKDLVRNMAKDITVVYTPLHGTGALHFERIMRDIGLRVLTVPEQREPDGNFPTVAFPNPEEGAALKLALELGKKEGADLVMATDPDADRLGIAVPDKKGRYVLVTGNQLGSLLADYLLLTMKEQGRLPERPVTIRSIVTTEMQSRIAENYGASCLECLTGFKWIADIMRRLENEGRSLDFVYGTEESYGFLVESEVRDKDGISAAAMTAEMTLYWRSKGKGLLDRLDELYEKYGYFGELGISKYFSGPGGMDIMRGIMEGYRSNQPDRIGGIKVLRVIDQRSSLAWNVDDPRKTVSTGMPSSDVLQWRLEDGSLVTVRPSGTEPKLKYYACVPESAEKGLEEAKRRARAKMAAIESDIGKIVGN